MQVGVLIVSAAAAFVVRGRHGGVAEGLGRGAFRGSWESRRALDTDLVVALTMW